MHSKTTTLIILLISFTALFLYLAMRINNSVENKTKVNPVPKIEKSARLYFVPDTIIMNPYLIASSSSEMFIDTGSNKISAVQIEMSFNPDILTIDSISGFNEDSFFGKQQDFQVSIQNIDNTNGRISFGVKINSDQAPKLGIGKLFNINFHAASPQMATQNTQIKFLNKTVVVDPETDISVLDTASPLNIEFNNGLDNNSSASESSK